MNWEMRMRAAIKAGRFTDEDRVLAAIWRTDPTSEFAHILPPRNNDVREGPVDVHLVLDGIWFTKGVEDQDVRLAVACYDGIRKWFSRLTGTPEPKPLLPLCPLPKKAA